MGAFSVSVHCRIWELGGREGQAPLQLSLFLSHKRLELKLHH